jgi:hypothetical protein
MRKDKPNVVYCKLERYAGSGDGKREGDPLVSGEEKQTGRTYFWYLPTALA